MKVHNKIEAKKINNKKYRRQMDTTIGDKKGSEEREKGLDYNMNKCK